MLEVIEAVKRVSGVNFPVRYSPRRPGDPAELVAGSRRMREILGWKPAYDNLDEIVRHALTWEKQLRKLREAPEMAARA